MARARPTEVKLVADLMEQAFTLADTGDGELDLDGLAREVIEALDQARAKRPMYAGVAYIPIGDGGVWKGVGPFTTPKQARAAMLQLAAPGPVPGAGRVVQLLPAPSDSV